MRSSYLLAILFATAVAGIGSAEAQTVIIEDDFVAPPLLAPAVPAVVPSIPVAAPGVVVVRRPPIVAAPPVVVAPAGCRYGYGYC